MIATRSALAKVVARFGLGIGLAVALVSPAGYLLVAYSQLGGELSLLAELKATRLARYIYDHRDLWPYHSIRLAELTEIPEAKETIAQQRILDSTGKLVLETGETPAWPIIARSAPIIVAGAQLATVETSTTLRPIVVLAAIVAAGSSLLGLAVYFVIRIFPMRIIDRTVAQLADTQGRLVATIDAIPIEFMEFDREGRLVLINDAARLSQGWDADSIGKTQRQLLENTLSERRRAAPQHDWDTWMAGRLATLGRTGSYEMTRPTGEAGRFFVKDMPGGGQVVLRIDITESKRREAELAAAHARYRLLFDANPMPMALIVLETDRFIAVNDTAVRQYGWSRAEFLAMTSDELYPPEDLPALREARARREGPGALYIVKGLRHRRKDGSLIDVEMTSRPFNLDGMTALLVMAQDVTGRVRAEQARQAAEAQLRQAQKMEAVGQLTGGIAHDFNNILMVILSNADSLQDDDVDAATLAERVESIGQAVDRASGLTRQLLAFSRQQPLSPKRTNISTLVAGTGELLRRSLGDHIEVRTVFADDLWSTNVDQAQLEAALVNLCVNARDAMPDGGRLLIETRNVTLDDAYVARHPDASAGDHVVLAVTDTGSGMPAETVARVFEPFFTTKDVGKGTGLGLSMVYGFIKQSNGHIEIVSDVGHGTCVKLYLPRSDGPQEPATVRPGTRMVGGRERILVVEDEPQVRAAVVEQLQDLGYTVSQSPDGPTALASCETMAQPYDLLLTDVMMPGPFNGKGLADRVARRWPTTKIVFMSGYAENVIVRDGHVDEGALLLSKPFNKKGLALIVRQALDGARVA